LAEAVVDLVAAGVVELVALKIDLRAAEFLRQPLGEIERARPPGIMGVEVFELGPERRVRLGRLVFPLQVEDQRHQRLGDETAAIEAEMAPLVRTVAESVARGCGHETILVGCDAGRAGDACRAAAMKARIISGSLRPGAVSTPDDTSTPAAPVMAQASATL